MEFKVGDVVRFRSGGPIMTITDIGDYDRNGKEQAKCAWFDKMEKKEGVFELETLEHTKKIGASGARRGVISRGID